MVHRSFPFAGRYGILYLIIGRGRGQFMKQNKQFFRRLLAVAFWLAVWQAAAMAIGQEVFLVSPV